MKKLFTFLLVSSLAVASFAQERGKDVILGPRKNSPNYPTSQDGKDIVLGRRDNGGVYNGSNSDREYRIRDINQEYDRKIWTIRNNPDLTSQEKDRIIRRLNKEREERIRQVNGDYGYGNKNDVYNGKNKKHHKDNGKHLGWEKGKGNQKHNHQHGDDD